MIQRIQSIFLLLAGTAGAALFTLPFATANVTTSGVFQDGKFNIFDNNGLMILAVMTCALALMSIFLYKNRVLQMNVGKLNMILAFVLMAWALVEFFSFAGVVSFGIGLFLPFGTILFTVLANRNILKDELLVRSADRIR